MFLNFYLKYIPFHINFNIYKILITKNKCRTVILDNPNISPPLPTPLCISCAVTVALQLTYWWYGTNLSSCWSYQTFYNVSLEYNKLTFYYFTPKCGNLYISHIIFFLNWKYIFKFTNLFFSAQIIRSSYWHNLGYLYKYLHFCII